jgi:hypothetical protein
MFRNICVIQECGSELQPSSGDYHNSNCDERTFCTHNVAVNNTIPTAPHFILFSSLPGEVRVECWLR